jgi:hypothetical protein
MKKTLKPFKGLDNIEFGMSLEKVQELVNIHTSEVTNKPLKESKVYGDKIAYVFNSDILVTIEMKYQEDVYFNDVNIFNTEDIMEVLRGFKIASKKDNIQVQELGLILLGFMAKNKTKRELWFYSKEMVKEMAIFLDVI